MSRAGDSADLSPTRPAAWDRLELAVRRLMDDYVAQQTRASAAEARIRELESKLSAISGGGLDPIELERRVGDLEAENQRLRERLEKARAEIERIMARLRFLEG